MPKTATARTTKAHPALASATRAICRAVATLTPEQVFAVAAYAERLAFGEDKGRWALSASFAGAQPEHHWRCDEPAVTKKGGV